MIESPDDKWWIFPISLVYNVCVCKFENFFSGINDV